MVTPSLDDHVILPIYPRGTRKRHIVCNEQKQYESLCDVISRPQLKSDQRFLDRPLRMINRDALVLLLEEALSRKSAKEWDRLLNAADVPAGVIMTLPEILEEPQIKSRKLIKTFESVKGLNRDIAVPRLGFHLASGLPDTDLPPPQLGQDTEQVLGDFGYTKDDVAELRRAGAI